MSLAGRLLSVLLFGAVSAFSLPGGAAAGLSADVAAGSPSLFLVVEGGGPHSTFTASQTVKLAAELRDAAGTALPLADAQASWTVERAEACGKAWARGETNLLNGLCWGEGHTVAPLTEPEDDRRRMAGTPPAGRTAALTDIVGERRVTVKVVMTLKTGASYAATVRISFGKGPLAAFDRPKGSLDWKSAMRACGDRLPAAAQLQAVSAAGKGAAFAAGWPQTQPSPRDEDEMIPGCGIRFPKGTFPPDPEPSPSFLYWSRESGDGGRNVFVHSVDLKSGNASNYPSALDGVAVCLP